MKQCGVCKKIKKKNQFNKRDDGAAGLKWACKECQKNKRIESDSKRYSKLRIDKNWVMKSRASNQASYRKLMATNPEKHKLKSNLWRIQNPDRFKAMQFKSRLKRKIDVLMAYSNSSPACKNCGIDDVDVLTIDHIDGGGSKHRRYLKETGKEFYLELKKAGYPNGYQVLCHNCNFKKYLQYKRSQYNIEPMPLGKNVSRNIRELTKDNKKKGKAKGANGKVRGRKQIIAIALNAAGKSKKAKAKKR